MRNDSPVFGRFEAEYVLNLITIDRLRKYTR